MKISAPLAEGEHDYTFRPQMRPACFGSAITHDLSAPQCRSCPYEAECGTIARERFAKYQATRGYIEKAREEKIRAQGRARKQRFDAKRRPAPPTLGGPLADAARRRLEGFDRLIAAPPDGAKAFLRQIASRRADLLRVWLVVERLRIDTGREPSTPDVARALAEAGRELTPRAVRSLRDQFPKLDALGWGNPIPERVADLVTPPALE